MISQQCTQISSDEVVGELERFITLGSLHVTRNVKVRSSRKNQTLFFNETKNSSAFIIHVDLFIVLYIFIMS